MSDQIKPHKCNRRNLSDAEFSLISKTPQQKQLPSNRTREQILDILEYKLGYFYGISIKMVVLKQPISINEITK